MSTQARTADATEDRTESTPALSTLANPRRIRWSTAQLSGAQAS